MIYEWNKLTTYIVLVFVFGLLLFLSVMGPVVTSNADFSIYNSGWNGCSHLVGRTREAGDFRPNIRLEGRKSEVVTKEITDYDIKANNTSMFIIGPSDEFTAEETEFIDRFLKEGGKLLLADDFGSGNSLLSGLNTNSSFYSRPLLDLSFDKEAHFGIAYDVREHRLTEDVSQVMLNNPTGIRKDEDSVSLLNSSKTAWLSDGSDRNYDKYPLITIEDYGEGELILFSDPSLFTNSMKEKVDNELLIKNTIEYISEGNEQILIDESKRDVDLLFRMVYTGNYPGRNVTALILLLVIGIGIYRVGIYPKTKDKTVLDLLILLFLKVRSLLFSEEEEEEEEKDPLDEILEENPEWNRKKLEKIDERFIKVEE